MFKIKILNWEKASTKIVIVVFTTLLLLSSYYIMSSYFEYLKNAEDQTLAKLQGISNTLSLQISGEEHEYLTKKYKSSHEIKTNNQDSIYNKIQLILANAFRTNHFKDAEEISTLILDSSETKLYYIVNSLEEPYFRDIYVNCDPQFIDKFQTGATINSYNDEFGTWLTAFSPIRKKNGEVVAIVEVDQSFDDFINNANIKLYKNLLFSIIVFIITAVILLRYVRVVLVKEEGMKSELQKSYHIINEKNRDILQSINYAKKIQNAILPPLEIIEKNLPESFVLNIPKDIVSGDFYFFYEIIEKTKFYIAVVDCTGHGVPGALMSMIGNDLLNNIIQNNQSISPANVLDLLNKGVINILKQDGRYGETRDGMDIALCLIDKENNRIEYAGANRPLYLIRKGNLTEIKPNKMSIGGYAITNTFTNNILSIEHGDTFYIFSDGITDQFGGPHNKKYMVKNVQKLLINISSDSMKVQMSKVTDEFEKWKGKTEQTDDVLLIAFQIN